MRRDDLGCAWLALLAFGGHALADNFPSHPITMVVPFSAGGPTDAMARILAERHAGHARPNHPDRECHGRRRLARRRPRGALGAGRLHHQHRPSRHPCRQRRDLQARLRSRHRSGAGGAAAEQSDDHRQQERGSGQIADRTAGLAEGKADAADRRHRRRRLGQPHRRALFREHHRHQAAISCRIAAPRRR